MNQFDKETSRSDFLKDEFKYLTGEVRSHIGEQFKLERYTLIGVIGIYAWLLTKSPSIDSFVSLAPYLFWLPPILVLFAMLRSASLYFTLEGIYTYIKRIEIELLERSGWQTFVVEQRKENYGSWMFRVTLTIFWFVLFIVTCAIAWKLAPL